MNGEPPLTLEPRDPRRPRRLGGWAMLAGVALAGALGLALGLAMQPQLISDLMPKGGAPSPAAEETGPAKGMDIVMAEPPPEAPLPQRPPLETMGPDLAIYDPPGVAEAPQPPIPPEPMTAPVAQIPRHAPMPPLARAAPEATLATRRPRFDCRDAGSLAEELVCTDAVLIAADRQLNRAYDRALRAGAPEDELAADQDEWMASREDAALRSPRALARLYDQRIAELNAWADEGR